jgi:hypothetical protein
MQFPAASILNLINSKFRDRAVEARQGNSVWSLSYQMSYKCCRFVSSIDVF